MSLYLVQLSRPRYLLSYRDSFLTGAVSRNLREKWSRRCWWRTMQPLGSSWYEGVRCLRGCVKGVWNSVSKRVCVCKKVCIRWFAKRGGERWVNECVRGTYTRVWVSGSSTVTRSHNRSLAIDGIPQPSMLARNSAAQPAPLVAKLHSHSVAHHQCHRITIEMHRYDVLSDYPTQRSAENIGQLWLHSEYPIASLPNTTWTALPKSRQILSLCPRTVLRGWKWCDECLEKNFLCHSIQILRLDIYFLHCNLHQHQSRIRERRTVSILEWSIAANATG